MLYIPPWVDDNSKNFPVSHHQYLITTSPCCCLYFLSRLSQNFSLRSYWSVFLLSVSSRKLNWLIFYCLHCPFQLLLFCLWAGKCVLNSCVGHTALPPFSQHHQPVEKSCASHITWRVSHLSEFILFFTCHFSQPRDQLQRLGKVAGEGERRLFSHQISDPVPGSETDQSE